MKIHIAAPDIHVGDAVGNHCLALAEDFRDKGHTCELFAERSTSTGQEIRPLADLLRGGATHTSHDMLLVSHSIYNPNLRSLIKLPGRKIAYFHGITPTELLLEHDPVAAYYCSRGYAQLPLLAEFDKVVANSYFNLRELQQQIPVGLASERTSVIPPVSARFPLFNKAPRTPNAMPAAGQLVKLITVGRVVPHKCVEDLIEIVALLTQTGQPTELHIIGSCNNTEYRNLLQDVIAFNNLENCVHLHGMVSTEALAQHYQAANMLVVASKHEGFCVPVLEAMHFGLPVVVRSGTAASEVAGNASREFRDNAQASEIILSLLQYADMHNAMIRAGIDRSLKLLENAEWPLFQ